MKKIFREYFNEYISSAVILAAFGLALTILSAAFLAYQLMAMGIPEYAGMAVVIATLVIGLSTAILLVRQRREDLVQKQLALLMGDYNSPDSVARLQHHIGELESELSATSEISGTLRFPRKASPRLQHHVGELESELAPMSELGLPVKKSPALPTRRIPL